MSGQEVRALILGNDLRIWQVAYEMGVSEATLSRWFRKPFNEKAVAAVKAAIERLVQQREQEEK